MDYSQYLKLYSTIVSIKNDTGRDLKYAEEVRFSDSCLRLSTIFWIIILERLIMVGLILLCCYCFLGLTDLMIYYLYNLLLVNITCLFIYVIRVFDSSSKSFGSEFDSSLQAYSKTNVMLLPWLLFIKYCFIMSQSLG